jgi:hypothetical protein
LCGSRGAGEHGGNGNEPSGLTDEPSKDVMLRTHGRTPILVSGSANLGCRPLPGNMA